jgi:hypothetical protein
MTLKEESLQTPLSGLGRGSQSLSLIIGSPNRLQQLLGVASMALTLLLSPLSAAQSPSYTIGEPAIAQTTSSLVTSPMAFDVSQLSGADFCAQSTTAFTQTTPQPPLIFNGIGTSGLSQSNHY